MSRVVPSSRRDIPGVQLTLAASQYDGWVRESVIALKIGRRETVRSLAKLLLHLADDLNLDSDVVCVPIPSTPKRLKERGYNPVQIVADVAARISPDTIRVENLLKCTRDTDDSVGLNPRERRKNVQGAFAMAGTIPTVVVLIDDVVTTGATLESAAETLKQAGAREVFALALCASHPKGLR